MHVGKCQAPRQVVMLWFNSLCVTHLWICYSDTTSMALPCTRTPCCAAVGPPDGCEPQEQGFSLLSKAAAPPKPASAVQGLSRNAGISCTFCATAGKLIRDPTTASYNTLLWTIEFHLRCGCWPRTIGALAFCPACRPCTCFLAAGADEIAGLQGLIAATAAATVRFDVLAMDSAGSTRAELEELCHF